MAGRQWADHVVLEPVPEGRELERAGVERGGVAFLGDARVVDVVVAGTAGDAGHALHAGEEPAGRPSSSARPGARRARRACRAPPPGRPVPRSVAPPGARGRQAGSAAAPASPAARRRRTGAGSLGTSWRRLPVRPSLPPAFAGAPPGVSRPRPPCAPCPCSPVSVGAGARFSQSCAAGPARAGLLLDAVVPIGEEARSLSGGRESLEGRRPRSARRHRGSGALGASGLVTTGGGGAAGCRRERLGRRRRGAGGGGWRRAGDGPVRLPLVGAERLQHHPLRRHRPGQLEGAQARAAT